MKTVTLPLTAETGAMYEKVRAEFRRVAPYAKDDGPSVLRFALLTAIKAMKLGEDSDD